MFFLSQNNHNYSGGLLIQALIILLIATISLFFLTRIVVSLHQCSYQIQNRLLAINYALNYTQRIQHRQLALNGTAKSDGGDVTISWHPKKQVFLSFYNPIIKRHDTFFFTPIKIIASWRDNNSDHKYIVMTGVPCDKQ
jgi:hypothetical protein